jgi:hypothetical protein
VLGIRWQSGFRRFRVAVSLDRFTNIACLFLFVNTFDKLVSIAPGYHFHPFLASISLLSLPNSPKFFLNWVKNQPKSIVESPAE